MELPPAPEASEERPALPPTGELPAPPPALAPGTAAAEGGPGEGLPEGLPELSEPPVPPIPPMLPPPQEEAPKVEAAEPGGSAAVDKKDPEVTQTAADSTMIRSQIRPRTAQPAGEVAARVGDEVITLHELRMAVAERLQGVDPAQPPSEQEVTMLAASLLNELVERSIVVQEAKRELKDPKNLDRFMADADQEWRTNEIEPMLRKYAVANEYELKEKLKARGVSLDERRNAYRRAYLSQGYMKAKLGPKLTVSLPEMHAYYQKHFHDFDRPAQIVWREIVIECDKCESRAEARAKADKVLARLRRNEDFAKLAAVESHGPNKSKGGLWETTPGGYGVEAVNSALGMLPIGQISQVIEAPSSYHIVRVESRRAAGPASFAEAEVQNRIRTAIFNEKVQHETTAFIGKLRKQTLVTTMFDRSGSDPATIRTSMPR